MNIVQSYLKLQKIKETLWLWQGLVALYLCQIMWYSLLSMLFLARRAVLHCAMPAVSLSCQNQQWPLITWMALADCVCEEDHPAHSHPFVEKLRRPCNCCENSPIPKYGPGQWVIAGVYAVPVLRIPMCSGPKMEKGKVVFILVSGWSKQIVVQQSLTSAYWWFVRCHLSCLKVF